MENSTAVYIIKETDDTDGKFVPNSDGKENLLPGGTITRNPTFALGTSDGVVISPTTILNPEFDHGAGYDSDPGASYDRTHTPDEKYGNLEEKRVITGNEQRTALALGEIKPGQVTRTDHVGHQAYLMMNPTSNKSTPLIMMHMSLQRVTIKVTKPIKVNPKKDQ